ncbi:MAG: RluA family pseudouridine synthase [Flavobacteriales bacterium]|nr:RluA family pseudouridine synthase [Flavobacteriales bacterium]
MTDKVADRVLYEDNHILIINKLCGELVQGDKTGDVPLLESAKDYLKRKYNKPGNVFLGLPHRIDRPTSGVVIFARTSKSLSRLTELFRQKHIEKVYWAIVKKGIPASGELKNYLMKNSKQNKSYVYKDQSKGAKLSILRYEIIGTADQYNLLNIDLETGRHHQIRAQLSHLGFPIKGDLKYGFSRSNPDGGICLHARSVKFIHPIKKEPLYLKAPVPKDKIWSIFKA